MKILDFQKYSEMASFEKSMNDYDSLFLHELFIDENDISIELPSLNFELSSMDLYFTIHCLYEIH